jgi:hypothetical protein
MPGENSSKNTDPDRLSSHNRTGVGNIGASPTFRFKQVLFNGAADAVLAPDMVERASQTGSR